VGPWLIGHISDALKATYGIDALRNAAVACTAFYLVAALLMLLCVKQLRAQWIPDETRPSI
jgi:hypothetical protein